MCKDTPVLRKTRNMQKSKVVGPYLVKTSDEEWTLAAERMKKLLEEQVQLGSIQVPQYG